MLALGGGSVIDDSKIIAAQAATEENYWNVFVHEHRMPADKPLPLGAIVTAAGPFPDHKVPLSFPCTIVLDPDAVSLFESLDPWGGSVSFQLVETKPFDGSVVWLHYQKS